MSKWKFETLSLHGGQQPDPVTGSMATPVYQTTSFVFQNPEKAAGLFRNAREVWAPRLTPEGGEADSGGFPNPDSGNIYTRIMNPTTDVLEARMSLLEGGSGALAVSSGAAAVTMAVMNICRSGDHIVSSQSLYGGTRHLFEQTLPQYGISVSFFPSHRPDLAAEAVQDNTRCLFTETVGNPTLDTPDLGALAEAAHSHGIPLIVDNTVPTPYLCRPLDHGADISVHSLTKFCGGHGTSIGGAIVDSGRFPWQESGKFPMLSAQGPEPGSSWVEAVGEGAYIVKARNTLLRDMGACLSPFNSFLILQGLETLPVRMDRHCENALQAARFLEDHPRVGWVLYPGLASHPTHEMAKGTLRGGFGALIGFGIKGGLRAGQRFISHLELISHLANIGDAKTLAIHPASTTHSQLSPEEQEKSGLSPDFIRLSIGLEHIEDIIGDLDQALERA
jgi:O-acetylhomoserine (thiol)-lyase